MRLIAVSGRAGNIGLATGAREKMVCALQGRQLEPGVRRQARLVSWSRFRNPHD